MPGLSQELPAICTEYYPKITRYLRRLVGEADAEDVASANSNIVNTMTVPLMYFPVHILALSGDAIPYVNVHLPDPWPRH